MNVLKYKPFLVKPNNHEIGEIFGVELKTRSEVVPYAKKMQEMGAKNVLVSMAGEGAEFVGENGEVFEREAPKGKLVNSTGAGDSMVAGFLAGYMEKQDFMYALKMGLSAGSASAFSENLATKEEILNENIEALKKGMKNLYKHIDNLKNIFGQNVIVAINKFNTDTGVELNYLKEELSKRNIKVSIVESWAKGGNGAIDIAQKIVNMPESQTIKYCYDLNDSIVDKVRKVAQNVYGAENVIFSDETMKKVEKIEKLGYGNLPICIAKTQYSFSDNAKNIECAEKFNINIIDVELKAGAGFIVIYTGKIMTMPGLPQTPAAENIDISNDGEISGIF